jgi:hypothetical protein
VRYGHPQAYARRHHDRGAGGAHVGAVARARPRRRGPGIRVAVPIGSPHQPRRRVPAPLARHVDLAHGAGHAEPAHPLRPRGLAPHLLSPGAAREDGQRAGHALAGTPRPRHRRGVGEHGTHVRHPVPAASRAHGPPGERSARDPRPLARDAGDARSALFPAP